MGEKARKFAGRLAWEEGLQASVELQVREAIPREACGVLLGDWNGGLLWIRAAIPARNLAEEEGRFLLDPAAWIQAEGCGAELLIPWHSHPGGGTRPSREDQRLLEQHALIAIACLRLDRLAIQLWQ